MTEQDSTRVAEELATSKAEWSRYEEWDRILYGLCEKFPDHKTSPGVHAKVYLIERSYSAGLERHVESNGTVERLDRVAELLINHQAEVDTWIASVKRLHFGDHWIGPVCVLHGKFMSLLREVMRPKSQKNPNERRSARSFASKYLHFHAPVVPIYDKRASDALSGLELKPVQSSSVGSDASVDSDYAKFCARIEVLVKGWPTSEVTARDIDKYLLFIERRQRLGNKS